MDKISQLFRIAAHPRELRLALSGLGMRLSGDEDLGGLNAAETDALVGWSASAPVVVEIGTLFGFTAKKIAMNTSARVIAVDNFVWNPFGLTGEQHERFTRKVLDGSGVELVKADALDFLKTSIRPDWMVFLDGDHSYEGVKGEIELLVERKVRRISGHDYGNARFGVTRAVDEILGGPDEVVDRCWLKSFGGN